MTPTTLFARYLWLIELLSYSKGLSKSEIDSRWANSVFNDDGKGTIPRRTFIRMKDNILSLFDIQIVYDRKEKKYHIENDISGCNKNTQFLLSAFAVNQMVSENRDLADRILLEDTPAGSNIFLPEITTAMRENRRLSITYQNYEMQTAREFEIEPYALRYFGRRWYVLAHTDFHNSLRLYALDRMKDVKISDKLFKLPEDFSADDYFSRYFGVIVTDGKAENIQLKTTDTRAKYLRSLPLHRSQKEIASNLFELHLVPTDDFINAVRAMGTEVEIVSPDWVRKRLLQDAKDLVKKYSKKL
ncbi:MAG: WYL domain-containing protein [Bacteroidales bacterium]|nr:WYL domain-containing protein [Bacteroidales bacterium]MBR3947166.1 WYL domain-containing protein [Bacteroidales bacterium]